MPLWRGLQSQRLGAVDPALGLLLRDHEAGGLACLFFESLPNPSVSFGVLGLLRGCFVVLVVEASEIWVLLGRVNFSCCGALLVLRGDKELSIKTKPSTLRSLGYSLGMMWDSQFFRLRLRLLKHTETGDAERVPETRNSQSGCC